MSKSTRKLTLQTKDIITQIYQNNPQDDVFKKIEEAYNIKFNINRVGLLVVKGDKGLTLELVNKFHGLSSMGDAVTLKDIGDVILHNKAYPGSAPPSTNWHKLDFNDGDRIHTIQPKTEHQKQLIDGVIGRQIIFANGEAGVGKTFLACAIALKFLEKRMIKKIVITRPAITSEDFGFLPGDIDEKMSPFLLPINSIFEELIGKEKRDKYIEKGAIEILPIAYARGITLGNFEGVITIVDESENVELKNFYLMLTRLGDHPNSKIIFCGDSRQSDLSFNKKNSLDTVAEILKDSPYTSIVTFDKSDVVRSAVVKDIVARFEKYDDEKKKTK